MKRSLTLVGVLLAILGWYAPWVTSTRHVAALTFNALDLTEFCKFVNRAGTVNITREWFLVPLAAAALALALWASLLALAYRYWGYLLTLLAAVLMLVLLPPYPSLLKAYSSAEDRVSLGLSVTGLIGIALIFSFGQRITGRWRNLVFIALALIGVIPTLWEFFSRALPALSTVYASPALPAWGLLVTAIGFALVLVGALLPNG